MPPKSSCLNKGLPYSEVTEAICRVPSTLFSQAPRYTLPVHVCPFRVRSNGGAISWDTFTATPINKELQFTASVTTTWSRNIYLVPIDYSFRSRLRGRLTLRRLALRRNPCTLGDRVFHSVCRYSCQHSHF